MNRKNLFKNISLLLILVVVLFNCGYNFTTFKDLPHNFKKLYIGSFENRTEELGLENIFINELMKQLICQHKTEITSKEKADASLNGIILSLSINILPPRINKKKSPRELRCLTIVVEFNIKDPHEHTIWHLGNITERQYYFINSYETREKKWIKEKIIKSLIRKISQSIILKMIEEL